MRAHQEFKVIDSHSGGAPSRLVLSGVPQLAGASVMEMMHDFAAQHDWIRRALVLEPRRTRSDQRRRAAPAPITGEQTLVRLDTPAGLIEATARVEDGRVRGVSFVGAPAFCLLPEQKLEIPGFGMVQLDVSYGGNFYAIMDAAQFDLDLAPDTVDRAVGIAAAAHRAVNSELEVQHPALPSIRGVTHVQLFNEPVEDGGPTKVMVIMPHGLVDRSPCGTGTTAKVATLYAKGLLELGQPFVHRSVTGASFIGRPVEPSQVGSLAACRVEITGRAYLTADSTIYLDEDDELAGGFHLG